MHQSRQYAGMASSRSRTHRTVKLFSVRVLQIRSVSEFDLIAIKGQRCYVYTLHKQMNCDFLVKFYKYEKSNPSLRILMFFGLKR